MADLPRAERDTDRDSIPGTLFVGVAVQDVFEDDKGVAEYAEGEHQMRVRKKSACINRVRLKLTHGIGMVLALKSRMRRCHAFRL